MGDVLQTGISCSRMSCYRCQKFGLAKKLDQTPHLSPSPTQFHCILPLIILCSGTNELVLIFFRKVNLQHHSSLIYHHQSSTSIAYRLIFIVNSCDHELPSSTKPSTTINKLHMTADLRG
jgi:hypothetical protein